MNILYAAGYKKRFEKVIKMLEGFHPKNVTELCFGDTIIAKYCRDNGIKWSGFDINNHFVETAKHRGFSAACRDLAQICDLPPSDVCIMAGSLYHFHDNNHTLFSTMLSSANNLIISEPIKNLSESTGAMGWIAHRLSNAGKGKESFRYNETSLLQMLKLESELLNFTYQIAGYYKKDIIIVIVKNETRP